MNGVSVQRLVLDLTEIVMVVEPITFGYHLRPYHNNKMVKKPKQQRQQQQCAPTERQKLREEAKERARRWARDTLGKTKAAATVKKSKNPISKEEAKDRARKWAKERFGEGNDSAASSGDAEEDEFNGRFHNLNIVVYDEEEVERERHNKKAEEPRKGYSRKYQQSNSSSTSSHNCDGHREQKQEHRHSSNNFRHRGFGATYTPAPTKPPRQTAAREQYTKEQAETVERVIQASKSGKGSHYRVLNVFNRASHDDIKKSYRKIALQIHPDKNFYPMAAEAFKVLGSSYDVLKSESKRTRYDRRTNPSTSSNSSSRSGHRHRASGYYGAREKDGFRNTAHGSSSRKSNPFGNGTARASKSGEPERGGGSPDFGGSYYQSSSHFGDNGNPYEGARRY